MSDVTEDDSAIARELKYQIALMKKDRHEAIAIIWALVNQAGGRVDLPMAEIEKYRTDARLTKVTTPDGLTMVLQTYPPRVGAFW